MSCAGIHRELSQRVKGVGHSKFTQEEADRMRATDNDKINLIWLARYDPRRERMKPPVDNVDQNKLKSWILVASTATKCGTMIHRNRRRRHNSNNKCNNNNNNNDRILILVMRNNNSNHNRPWYKCRRDNSSKSVEQRSSCPLACVEKGTCFVLFYCTAPPASFERKVCTSRLPRIAFFFPFPKQQSTMELPQGKWALCVAALLALSVVTLCHAWSTVARPTTASTSPLFVHQRQQQRSFLYHDNTRITTTTTTTSSQLFAAAAENNADESEDTEEKAVVPTGGSTPGENSSSLSGENDDDENDDDEQEESYGVVKTILLAGPLFVKFTIVLLIKFATDLIVFPLLWLYRLARLTKRKFLKMIGKGGRDYPNGETKPE